jgi:hypothetical protein
MGRCVQQYDLFSRAVSYIRRWRFLCHEGYLGGERE